MMLLRNFSKIFFGHRKLICLPPQKKTEFCQLKFCHQTLSSVTNYTQLTNVITTLNYKARLLYSLMSLLSLTDLVLGTMAHPPAKSPV